MAPTRLTVETIDEDRSTVAGFTSSVGRYFTASGVLWYIESIHTTEKPANSLGYKMFTVRIELVELPREEKASRLFKRIYSKDLGRNLSDLVALELLKSNK